MVMYCYSMLITMVKLSYDTEWWYCHAMVVNYHGRKFNTLTPVAFIINTTIVNDDSSVVSKWSSKLIDDGRVIIYYRNMLLYSHRCQGSKTKIFFLINAHFKAEMCMPCKPLHPSLTFVSKAKCSTQIGISFWINFLLEN